jgi:hypothetical protein
MRDDGDNLVRMSNEHVKLCTDNYQTDDVPMPLADLDEPLSDFTDHNEGPVPNNNPPIPPGDVADQNEGPVPDHNPPIPPGDDANQHEPPVPNNNPPIPPDAFADQNEGPVPDHNPHIPPGDVANQHEPPVPNNAPEGDGHQQEYQFVLQRQPRPNIDVEALAQMAVLPKMKEMMEYILALRNASLEDPIAKLDDAALERLRNPPREPVVIDSPSIRHSISSYLALEHASQEAYNRIQRSTKLNFAGAAGVDEILSFYSVEKIIAQYTGVESIKHDMCPKSCLAFTGPFAALESCPMCDTSRWDQARLRATNGRTKVAAQTFTTLLLGPQLQALYRHPDSAQNMRYFYNRVQEVLADLTQTGEIPVFDDIAMGHDAIGAVLDGDIKENDIVLMVSLDGAQLYESKQSDCWMYIWVVVNLSPDKRYRKAHVRPGGFIPGPNKPKNLDSFLVVGLHHLAALQNEGLVIWDSSRDVTFTSDLYLIFTTADGPGLVYWDGMVGHSGKNGCRVYCGVLGRRKPNGTHYYPALLKPLGRCAPGSDHPDISVFRLPPGGSEEYADNLRRLITSPSQRQLDIRKTETGITRPPLILGLKPSRCLGIPHCMTTDIMHLAGNLSDLLVALWRGTIDCGITDDVATWD